ncbi:MAG: VOC family protein, partial [Polaromonas sp.]|nr:VOC family protein [Polaromonas sp.]MDO8373886.1 VOC family protein [Polaromonas sp.]
MFSHVMVGVSDLEASKKFYDAVLGTLGIGPGVANKNRYFYRSPGG